MLKLCLLVFSEHCRNLVFRGRYYVAAMSHSNLLFLRPAGRFNQPTCLHVIVVCKAASKDYRDIYILGGEYLVQVLNDWIKLLLFGPTQPTTEATSFSETKKTVRDYLFGVVIMRTDLNSDQLV